MKRMYKVVIGITLLIVVFVGLLIISYQTIVLPIHVVISPIVGDKGYPMNGSFVVYYDDYFNQPTSYWKKDFHISNDTATLVNDAISDANFVSSPVVIVAPYWFEQYFHNVTNAEGQPVKYQWYGQS